MAASSRDLDPGPKLTMKLARFTVAGSTLNPFFRAVSRFRQRRWDECIDICTFLLEQCLGIPISRSSN